MAVIEVVVSPFTLNNGYGDPIAGELRYVEGFPEKPAVVICHSFMAFKDWGFFPYVARRLAESGFIAVTFNFSLNGAGPREKITDFEKFGRNTFSRELHDLQVVVDAVRKNALRVPNLAPHLALLGHSRGGGMAIVFASQRPDVHALVTWSAISTFDRWTGHQKSRWRELGFLPLAKDAAVSPLRLGIGLLDDYEQHRDSLDIIKAASAIDRPWLLIHGKADVTVAPREAEALYAVANKTAAELAMLDHVGHLFNASSYEDDHYRTLDHVLDMTIHWLHRQLL